MTQIRKHKGINQQSGKLKKGFKYSNKKLKSGLSQIIKIKSQKHTLGGKYISKGTYGCIVSPAYNCKKSSIFKKDKTHKHVSKLSSIQSIPKVFTTLALIDPKNNHFIYPSQICTIDKQIVNQEDLEKCQEGKQGIDLSNNIILNSIMKKGTNDLNKYRYTNIHINKATKFLTQLLYSIKLLTKHNILHLDIKAANIVEYKNKVFIIDFDDLFNPTNVSEFNKFILSFDYLEYIWPPEVFMSFRGYPELINPDIKKYNKQFITNKNFKMFIQKIMIYLTGNIFNYMQLRGQNIEKFKEIIQQMTVQNPYNRPNINQTLKLLSNFGKLPKI